MAGDWVKLHRKIIESQAFSDPDLLRLWIFMLCRANYRRNFFRGAEVAVGEMAFTHRLLADALGWSRGKLGRALARLTEMGNITIKAGRDFSVISICNWASYQACGNEAWDADGAANGATDRATDGAANGAIPKKGKKLRREEGKKSQSARPTLAEVEAYCRERSNGIDPGHFHDYYEAQGWRRSNGNPIRDWRAAVRTWERNQANGTAPASRNGHNHDPRGNQAAMQRYLAGAVNA
jgi:hypothetical protein